MLCSLVTVHGLYSVKSKNRGHIMGMASYLWNKSLIMENERSKLFQRQLQSSENSIAKDLRS